MTARKRLLAEIDITIDQLIQNGETLRRITSDPQYQVEAAALEKTQESLLAHLMHLQEYLEDKAEKPPHMDQSIKKLITPPRSSMRLHKAKSLSTHFHK